MSLAVPPASLACRCLLQIMEGLKRYFDKALRHFLLYLHEVPQCDEALAGGAAPSDAYGVEHLLRLLVKLPDLVPITHMSAADRSIFILEARLKDFMTWLTELPQQASYFSMPEEYEPNPHWNEALIELVALPSTKAGGTPAVGSAGAAISAPAID